MANRLTALEVIERENAKLKAHVDAVLRTESGRVLWAQLAKALGFFGSSLIRKADGEIAPLATECKEAQRLIYLQLRQLPSRELLKQAEDLADAPLPPVVSAKSVEEERKKNA